MRDTIERYLTKGYGLKKQIQVPKSDARGYFSLPDRKSCEEAAYFELNRGLKLCPDGCSHDIITIKANAPVNIIDIEQLFEQFRRGRLSQGKKCDKLVYSAQTIAFVELSCIRQKYLENKDADEDNAKLGKRAKAYSQLQDSIAKLLYVPEIRDKIQSYPNKIAVFGYRLKENKKYNDNIAAKNMNAFSWVERSHRGSQLRSIMDDGFYFYILKYPEPLIINQ